MQCTTCQKGLGVFPYKCKFCSSNYCDEHRLPENHSCVGLKKWKEKSSKRPEEWLYKAVKEEPKVKTKFKEKKFPTKQIIAGILIILILISLVLTI